MSQILICDKAEECRMYHALLEEKTPCFSHGTPHNAKNDCTIACTQIPDLNSKHYVPVKEK